MLKPIKKKVIQALITQHCLPIGRHSIYTRNNVAQYLLGSRNGVDLFRFSEIKHLLLKFTPLMETLFNSKLVIEHAFVGHTKKILKKPTPPKDPEKLPAWRIKVKNFKMEKWIKKSHYEVPDNKEPVKILFASINPEYSQILIEAATLCHMSAKTNRWLCGYITANPSKYTDSNLSTTQYNYLRAFKRNKEPVDKRHEWHYQQKTTNRPTLAIIPDIHNNSMILHETFIKDIPVIGLVHSDNTKKIAYPIFGNADSLQIVHFFSKFLAVLIAKTYLKQSYKKDSHRIFTRTRAKKRKKQLKKKMQPQKSYLKLYV